LGEPRGPATVQTTADQISAAAGAKASGENFPVALRLLPARYRRHLEAVYGYARAVDDMGDEAPPGQRARLLDDLEADLGRLYRFQGTSGGEPPRLGVVRALASRGSRSST
jgi:phytoene/squalene synthetase